MWMRVFPKRCDTRKNKIAIKTFLQLEVLRRASELRRNLCTWGNVHHVENRGVSVNLCPLSSGEIGSSWVVDAPLGRLVPPGWLM